MVGFAYLASFIIPIVTYLFLFSGRFHADDATASVQRVLHGVHLFRLAVFMEVATAVVNTVLGALLYAILRATNRNWALLGLLLKFTEVVISVVISLGHLAALLMLQSAGGAATGETATMIGAFINAYIDLTSIAGLFLGLGMMVFSALLSQTNLIPRKLAATGVVSYALVFFYDSLAILNPDCAGRTIVQVVGTLPVCLFTVTAGILLLIAGSRDVPEP